MEHIRLVVLSAVILLVAAKLPDNFETCKRNDPELNTCLVDAIQKALVTMKDGHSELGMPALDPLTIQKITIKGEEDQPVDVHLDISNATVKGLGDVSITAVNADLDKRCLEVNASFPATTVTGDYTMDGSFKDQALKGEGKCTLALKNFNMTLKLHADALQEESKMHWDIKEFNLRVLEMDIFEINFENLFDGDKDKELLIFSRAFRMFHSRVDPKDDQGDNANKLLNDYWREFFEELRPTLRATFGAFFRNISNIVFHKISEDEMFP